VNAAVWSFSILLVLITLAGAASFVAPAASLVARVTGTAGIVPAPEPPDVDFDVEIALLVAAGERPTGGHTVTIEAARLIGDTLHVDTVERSPGRGCMVTQAITYPATAAAVEKVDAEAVFHVREERRDC